MTNPTNPQTTALDAYVVAIHELSEKLTTLTQYAENHGNVNPDDVNWGHVGSLGHVNEELNDLMNFLGIYPKTNQAGE